MEIRTLADRRDAAAQLGRLLPQKMTPSELDLACALVLGKVIRMPASIGNTSPEVLVKDAWFRYAPTSDWNQLGEVLTMVGVVTGNHEECSDPNDFEKVTGRWYSCHAYVGGTSTDGRNLPNVICQTVAKLLQHDLEFAEAWNPK